MFRESVFNEFLCDVSFGRFEGYKIHIWVILLLRLIMQSLFLNPQFAMYQSIRSKFRPNHHDHLNTELR